eukprot:4701709-Pyramimonas_sp.AAC.1
MCDICCCAQHIPFKVSYKAALDRGEVKEKKGTDGITYNVMTTFAVKDEQTIAKKHGAHGSRAISDKDAQ